MYPARSRIKELQDRFDVFNGRFFAFYRYKNLNWYLNNQWFCFGDIRDEDIPRIVALLEEGELLILGFKDMGPDELWSEFFGDGGGIWMILSCEGVKYDRQLALN